MKPQPIAQPVVKNGLYFAQGCQATLLNEYRRPREQKCAEEGFTYASASGNIAELRKELHCPKMASTARPAPRLDSLMLLFKSQVICQRIKSAPRHVPLECSTEHRRGLGFRSH